MTDDTAYIPRNPGDLISAKDWGDVQVMIKKDIAARIAEAIDSVKKTGVDRAGDADEFAGKNPDEWTKGLDERYAPKVHDHEGTASYRRYIKRFKAEPGFERILLPHKLGRYPLVEAYKLFPVVTQAATQSMEGDPASFAHCKLFFYYGNEDADRYGLWAVAYRDRVPLGLPLGPLLEELHVPYTDTTSIQDLLNELKEALAKDPNDRIEVCQSPWVDTCCERHRTVAELKSSGQWDDFYLAIRPQKCAIGADFPLVGPDNIAAVPNPPSQVDVTHANYDTLLVEVNRFDSGDQGTVPLDLMFLLRS